MEVVNTKLTGTYYLGKATKNLVDGLEAGTELFLEREPNNQYDCNAIKVILNEGYGEIHIGYIPKDDNEELAELMDDGVKISAEYKGSYKLRLEFEESTPKNSDEFGDNYFSIIDATDYGFGGF